MERKQGVITIDFDLKAEMELVKKDLPWNIFLRGVLNKAVQYDREKAAFDRKNEEMGELRLCVERDRLKLQQQSDELKRNYDEAMATIDTRYAEKVKRIEKENRLLRKFANLKK